jgi:hypothetical protein
LPAIGNKIASKANRDGVAERFTHATVQKRIAVDLSLRNSDAQLLCDLEVYLRTSATQHQAKALYLLCTVPGVGKILRLVILYASHASRRFPRVQSDSDILRRWSQMVDVGCPSPEPATNWRAVSVPPLLGIGRYEGTDRSLGRRRDLRISLQSPLQWR